MVSRELPVKLSRVITLFGIVSATIIAIAIVVSLFLFSLPSIWAIGWHLSHGNSFAFEGHTFQVPLMRRCTSEPYRKSSYIEEARGNGLIELTSTNQILDSTATRQWQTKKLDDDSKMDKVSFQKESALLIKGQNLEFVCVNHDIDMPHPGDFWECRVSNTDIAATIVSPASYHGIIRSVIDTAK